MQNIIICEDSKTQANYLKQEVLNLHMEDVSITIYQSATELIKDLPNINTYSIFLLDVVMPDINGIAIAQAINQCHPQSCIIYVTAYLNTVTDAQDTNHCYFLLKKDIKNRLPIAMEKAMKTIKEMSKTILITSGNAQVVVNLNDILYLERIKRYTYIVMKNEKLRIKEDLPTMMNMLTSHFYRCHNSYIINFDKVTAKQKDAFIISDTLSIPISRSYIKSSEIAFHNYIVHTF